VIAVTDRLVQRDELVGVLDHAVRDGFDQLSAQFRR